MLGRRHGNNLGVRIYTLDTAVAFYGRQPELTEVSKIKADLMLHYAEHDDRINSGIEALWVALKQHKIDYSLYRYEGTQHAFHNDTAPTKI